MSFPFSLKQLETFYWSARLGSFAQAATRLHSTASAVSMRIKEMERNLGQELFDRSQRQARLTAFGASLIPLAEEVIRATGHFTETAVNDPSRLSGHVRLGVTENVAVTWLGSLMRLMRQNHPLIGIELEIAISFELEEQLQSRLLDMAFGACIMPSSKFRSQLLHRVDFRWMADPRMTDLPDVLTPDVITDLPVLSVTRERDTRGSLLDWHQENHIHYRNVTVCNSFRTTASMAMDGLGITQLPIRLFGAELSSGRLKLLRGEPEIPLLDIHAISPLSSLTPAHDAVIEAARQVALPYDDHRP